MAEQSSRPKPPVPSWSGDQAPTPPLATSKKVNLVDPSEQQPRSLDRKAATPKEPKKRPRSEHCPGPLGLIDGSSDSLFDMILVRRREGDEAYAAGNFSDAGSSYSKALELCGPRGEGSMRASLLYNFALCQICDHGLGREAAGGGLREPSKPENRTDEIEQACAALAAAAALEPANWPEPHALAGHAQASLLHKTGPVSAEIGCTADFGVAAASHLWLVSPQAMKLFEAAIRASPRDKALRIRLPNGETLANRAASLAAGSTAAAPGRGSGPEGGGTARPLLKALLHPAARATSFDWVSKKCGTSRRVPEVARPSRTLELRDLLQPFTVPYERPPRVPPGFICKESRGHRGRVFFLNCATQETSWDFPKTKKVRYVSGVSSMRIFS